MTDKPSLIERLSDEADLCRNDGADDIAALLDEARHRIESGRKQWEAEVGEWLRRFSEHLVRDQEVALLAAADAIERGEYRKQARDAALNEKG